MKIQKTKRYEYDGRREAYINENNLDSEHAMIDKVLEFLFAKSVAGHHEKVSVEFVFDKDEGLSYKYATIRYRRLACLRVLAVLICKSH